MKAPEVIEKEVIAAREGENPVYALRLLCETYSQAELHVAKNHFNCIATDPLGMVVLEAINLLRHRELTGRIAALEKPHWTLVPTFWFVVAGTTIGLLLGLPALIIGYLAWQHPKPVNSERGSSNQLSPNDPATIQAPPRSVSQPVLPPTNSIVAPSYPKKK